MLKKPERPSAWAGRTAGVVAAAAVAAAVVLLPPTGADAAPAPAHDRLPPVPAAAARYAVPVEKLPRGAVRATRGPAQPGPRSRVFQAPAARQRVVSGTPVNAVDHPGVVGIRLTYIGFEDGALHWYSGVCTGTVLSPTRVLTAGHCAVDLAHGHLEVIAGRNDLSDDTSGFVARVKGAWTHPGYNYERLLTDPSAVPVDDITVLTLRDPLPAAYVPVTLAAQGAPDPAAGTPATVVGYGVTDEDRSDSGILRAGTVAVAADITCSSVAQHGKRFDSNRMMCAGSPPVDHCLGDSGGPLFTGAANARVQVGMADWSDWDCGGARLGVYEALNHYSALVRQQVTQAGPDNLDWTGDGHADLLLRDPQTDGLALATGAGLLYGTPAQGATFNDVGINYMASIGSGNWDKFTKLFRVNNWSGDGRPSVFARDAAGLLFAYRSDGKGNFTGQPVQIGTGWNAFTDIMVTSNWTGNGLPNLMGRTADGRLMLYNSDGRGGWLNPRGTEIGTGWGRFDTVLTPGAWLGDGMQSLIGRNAAGELWLYISDGAGGWANPRGTQIGAGWGGFRSFMSPGDFDGDNLVDMLAVRSNGELVLHATNGRGAWRNAQGRLLGYAWTTYDAMF